MQLMSKRKLTRQQAWRINKIQQERAKRAQQRDLLADQALTGGKLGPEQEGLVVAHYGTQVAVEGTAGEGQRCHLRANVDSLVTGDRVIWCPGEATGVVVARLQRRGELCRPDAAGTLKPVAANIDQIMIVIAPLPQPHANLIDRYLVACEASGIEPVLLLNKVDLLAGDPTLAQDIESLLDVYPTLGYRLLRTSAKQDSIDDLAAALADRITVFVGQSGVGKSSLVNQLLPDVDLRVGALSESTDKGVHTTTTAQLFHLPCGGSLIDSPGIREFGLWHMTREQVESGFREFRPYLGHCKFRDCRHEQEPQCAVLSANARGEISDSRLESYRFIVSTLENV